MPITEAQKERRRKHLGSSDVAAILGLDPYRNAYDVWLDKTGQIPYTEENQAMYAGTVFESGVLEYAERELGKLVKNQYRIAEGFPMAANLDAILVATGEPIEAKTSGLFGPLSSDWGDNNTDQVPDRVVIQTHVQMLCVNKDVCYVPAFLGGRGFLMYCIGWSDEIGDVVRDKAVEFWDGCVLTKTPPPDIIPSLPIARKIHREANKTIDIPLDVVTNWLGAKGVLKSAEELKSLSEAKLLSVLGDAEVGLCSQGEVTYFEQRQKRIDTTRIKAEAPDVVAEFTKELKFRVARFKKAKPEKFKK